MFSNSLLLTFDQHVKHKQTSYASKGCNNASFERKNRESYLLCKRRETICQASSHTRQEEEVGSKWTNSQTEGGDGTVFHCTGVLFFLPKDGVARYLDDGCPKGGKDGA